MKKYKSSLIGLSFLIILAIIWSTVTEKGIKDLSSDFEELTFIRNEQNTGPVLRIYAVSLKKINWEEMKQYGNFMPHTKYGSTKIYFFLNSTDLPQKLKFGEVNIDDRYKKHCVAIYEKNGMSQISLRKYPFRD